MFETLVRVDCQGGLRPGLAAQWSPDSARRTWTFTLYDEARFPDGAAVTTAHVVSSWRDRRPTLDSLGVDSVSVLDDRRFAVTLRDLRDSVPHLFAEPALAIIPPGDSVPPHSARVTWSRGGKRPALHFQVVAPGTDLRDALDRGADLLVTRDPTLVEYASSRQEFSTFPLPWSRTYVLLQPAGAALIEANIYEDSARRSFARDAVQADARPAQAPPWWNGPCTTYLSMHVVLTKVPRIVYPQADPVARALAERVVALATGGVQLRAAGLSGPEFATALRDGGDLGYVLALPRQTLATCRKSASLAPGFRIYSLIDTRAHVIVRKGAPPLTVDWDGTVRLLQP